MSDPDARLMLRFQAGDRGAFDELFRRWSGPLVNFLGRMIPERARAEELAQEAFVRVHQARERYEPRTRFSTWLFGIAQNLARNELDRAHRTRERPLEHSAAFAVADPGPDPAARLDALRSVERLERALQTLPERQRAALLLRAQEERSYEEIAEILGASVASVKSLLHRARESLLAALGESGA